MQAPRKRSLLLVLASLTAFAQTNVLNVVPPPVLKAKAGAAVDATVSFELRQGFHVNSNTPSDDYLIPLKLTWNPGPLTSTGITYPKPALETYSFSKTPLSVFSGEFALVTHFQVPANAPVGPAAVTGKLRYQACNDRMCLPPRNLDVSLQIDIVK